MNQVHETGMRKAFDFQFSFRSRAASNREYFYVFRFKEPIPVANYSTNCETRHLELKEVFFVEDGRHTLSVGEHWGSLTAEARNKIYERAWEYVEKGLAKARGKVYTWREVFDNKRPGSGTQRCFSIAHVAQLAAKAGYSLFMFNDAVYSLQGNADWKDTGYTIENVA